MGEVLFKYWPGRIPMYQMAFSYWYSRTTEYRFAYHRYVTSVDASKLKGPVAITKVASGFRRIEDCFWAYNNNDDNLYDINKKPEYLASKVNHLEEFIMPPMSERHKNLVIMHGVACMYTSKDMEILKDIFANKDISMSIYHDVIAAFGHNDNNVHENNMESLSSGSKETNDRGYISIVPNSGKSLNETGNVVAHKDFPEGTTGMQINAETTVPEWSEYGNLIAERTWPEFNMYRQYMAHKIRPISENIFEQVSGGNTWKLMDIYNSMYSSSYDKSLNRFPNNDMASSDTSEFELLQDINTEREDNELNRLNLYMAEKAENIMSILEDIRAATPPDKHLVRRNEESIIRPEAEWELLKQVIVSIDNKEIEYHNDIFSELPDKVLNGIAQLFGWHDDPQVVLYKEEHLKETSDIVVNIRDDIAGYRDNPQVNWTSQIYGERPQPETNVYDIYIAYRTDKKRPVYLPSIDILAAYKDNPVVNMLQGVSGHSIKDAKEVICNVGYSVEKPPTTDTILNMDTFVIHEEKYAVVFNGTSLQGDGKNADGLSFVPVFGEKTKGEKGTASFQQGHHASKKIKDTMIPYEDEFVYGVPKGTMIRYRNAAVDKSGKLTIVQYVYPTAKRRNRRKTSANNGVWTGDSIKNQTLSVYDHDFAYRPIRDLYGESVELLWGDKIKKLLRADDVNEWVSKTEKHIDEISTGVSADRSYYQLFGSLSDDIWGDRKDYPVSSLKRNDIWVNREKYDMGGLKDQEEFIEKVKYSMWSEDQFTAIYRTEYDMNNIPTDAFLQKTKYELDFIKKTTDFVYRKPYVLSRFEQPEFLHKFMKPMQTVNDIESLWRTSYDLDLFLGISSEDTIFVPITKTRHNTFIDRVNEFLWRYPYLVGYTFSGEFMSPIPRDVWMEYDPLFYFREPYKAMLDYKNEMIFKLNVKSAMQRKEWSCDKIPKDIFIDPEDEWTSKTVREINAFHQPEDAHKISKPVWICDSFEPIYRTPKALDVYKDEWINRTPYLLYYTYGVFSDKLPKYLGVFDSLPEVDKQPQSLDMADHELWFDTKWRDIFIEDVAFTGREAYESHLFQEAVHAKRACREIEEFTNDFSNWAWVYEVPDPLEPEFGIDELLLPENDTRYSDFENIIFNPATMKPRNPVKQIDNTTFIAKYPTKHPFPERADAGRYYDDSAIKFENYYGIESEVMYMVYLQFFKIWQARVFEFGGMDMVHATKKMLEYIYTWIVGGGLPLEKLQQGLRVYRQIRWYAESAVIRNSQYVVTYELDALHSNLHTGKCDIPNDLHPGGTMFIDQNLAVIRCDPSTINNGPASVTFFLDTYKNSIMTFSLLNTVGSVNIYVDGVLVDTRSVSGRVSVDLIYTGDTIEVKIEKDAANNRNKYFYIGDITVPDLSYKDLKVSFDPTLKMGNKPLDEVMKKMLQYANLYDDINEAYDRVRKGNLGVNETYRLMLQYWELHHKNKIKGKRLTIKET